MSLHSLQLEKHVLAGLLKFDGKFWDYAAHLKEKTFFQDFHSTAFSLIKHAYSNNQKPSPLLIAEKIKQMGIVFEDLDNPYSYLESLSNIKITAETLDEAVKKLSALEMRRDLVETAETAKGFVIGAADKTPDEIISGYDKINNSKIQSFELDVQPVSVFGTLEDMVEERGNNPMEELGYKTGFPVFNRRFGGLMPGEISAIVARAGIGKALEENTEIPTPTGWTKIKDLKAGDEVFSMDGTVAKVLATKNWKNRPVYKITTSDGETLIADENHEWIARYRTEYGWKKYTTKEMFSWHKRKVKWPARIALPTCEPLKLPKRDLKIHPYLMGLWLGNGAKAAPLITSNLNDIKYFEEKISALGYRIGNTSEPNNFSILGIKHIFREYNLLFNKHIPDDYLRASFRQRKELLEGLIDSDGYQCLDGGIEFTNTNLKIAEGFLELIHSMGIKCRMGVGRAMLNGVDCGPKYRMTFFPTIELNLSPRKGEGLKTTNRTAHRYIDIEEFGTANTVCIEVDHPSHLFLAGRGMIPTHNSSILIDMAWKTCNVANQDIHCLFLDTELFAEKVQFRLAAALSGVPLWFIATGNWRKDPEMVKKVRAILPTIKKFKLDHLHVANKNIEEINSIIRHWYYSKVGRGGKAVVVYDYIKMTGEKSSEAWKEHQIIGEKIDMLKRIAGELNIPVLTAMQLNRTGESKGRKAGAFIEDSSAISLSDRLSWFGGFVGLLRRKTMDELVLDGIQFGTHLLLPLKTRDQGIESVGHQEFVQRVINGEKRYTQYYINYEIDKFNVKECGSIDDIIEYEKHQLVMEEKGLKDKSGDL